jgi:hypothetical protein
MSARPVGPGFSPLDEALGLLGNSPYSPQVLGWLARLGATLPFAQAAALLAEFTGLQVSAATVRRQTEAVGATAVAQAEAEVVRLEQELPAPSVAPERLVVGADGAMVPLVGGEWAEMKQVSVGEPVGGGAAAGSARTGALSYFARLADAETFGRLALGELHRRGLEAAGTVAAVQDGAPWLQGFVDLHRPDAVRILDWPHAAEHLTGLAEALFGEGTPRARRVAERLRRWLWEEGPTRVLRVLAGWVRARPELASAVAYFQERRAQLDYPAFRADGWPVGSGATESAHKQVMQARMKRAGMRWARAHVNPLLALRTLECNGRWASDGPTLLRHHRARRRHPRPPRLPSKSQSVPCPAHGRPSAAPAAAPRPLVRGTASPALISASPRPRRPSADHPWRRYGGWLVKN